MIQFLGIHIGTLYFPTSILLITLLVLLGFIIYFLSRKKEIEIKRFIQIRIE